jgi:GH18 family chitinase
MKRLTCLLALVALFLVACAAEQPDQAAPAVAEEATMVEPAFRVLAYVTAAVIPELIPYERLTHINYSFLIPNADGTFAALGNGWKIKEIVAQGRPAGVKVMIAVGGWGWHDQFEAMAADPARRTLFVQNLTAFVAEYELDGVDMDWEYPQPGAPAQNFLALVQELRQAMPADKLLTTAVAAYGQNGDGILSQTFALFDFINVMTYDGPDHGTMAQFDMGLAYWRGRGLPAEKIVMGVPFYGRPGNAATYRQIVTAKPPAAYLDTTDFNGVTVHYNGIPTIQAKTRIALDQAGGIMFWTLEHDAAGDLSLLKAIDETLADFDNSP